MTSNITANMMVKNEEKWIWFAIMSVIDFVDHIIIFDTGSTDNTVDIINKLINTNNLADKITFEEKGSVDKNQFTLLRQEQLNRTKTKWFLLVDGDEIWYKKTLINLIESINNNAHYTMIATRFHNCVGDIFHYKNFKSESYKIKDVFGSITIRAYSKDIEGIYCGGPYGIEGYFDINNNEVQKDEINIFIQDGFYLHTSYLQRSSSIMKDWKIPYRRNKVFARINNKVDKDFKFPEVFYIDRPSNINNPFQKMGFKYYLFRTMYLVLKTVKFFIVKK
jgi:glycosyltransferase involved in cell wall biosynthesis